MTLARRPSPFGELLSLRQAMDRLFEDSFVRPGSGGWGFGPTGAESMALPLDVSTTNDELVIQATLPGVKPEDVDITIENGTLTIRGETTSERNEGEGDYLVREIRRGTFSRSVSLPNGLEPDKASASFDNGMLTLRVPKAEQVKPRQIRISPTVDGQSNGRDTKKVSAGTTSTGTSTGTSASRTSVPTGSGSTGTGEGQKA
jgi:HSP20 family protein